MVNIMSTNNKKRVIWRYAVYSLFLFIYFALEINDAKASEVIYPYEYYNLARLHHKGYNGRGIKVAIMDTGIYKHCGFNQDNIKKGISISNGNVSTNTVDSHGHGTAIASIIAGKYNKNNRQYKGIAYGSTIIPIKIFSDVSGLDKDFKKGINYAISQNADVINMSLGFDQGNTLIKNSILSAAKKGIIMVAAAGNDGIQNPTIPALYANHKKVKGMMLSVVSADMNGNMNHFGMDQDLSASNKCGTTKEYCISAPGNNIFTYGVEHKDSFMITSGTSMSVPQVVSAIALLKQAFPTLHPKEVVEIILRSASPINNQTSPHPDYGVGMLDINAAFKPQGKVKFKLRGGEFQYIDDDEFLNNDFVNNKILLSGILKDVVIHDDYNREFLTDITPSSKNYNVSSQADFKPFDHYIDSHTNDTDINMLYLKDKDIMSVYYNYNIINPNYHISFIPRLSLLEGNNTGLDQINNVFSGNVIHYYPSVFASFNYLLGEKRKFSIFANIDIINTNNIKSLFTLNTPIYQGYLGVNYQHNDNLELGGGILPNTLMGELQVELPRMYNQKIHFTNHLISLQDNDLPIYFLAKYKYEMENKKFEIEVREHFINHTLDSSMKFILQYKL